MRRMSLVLSMVMLLGITTAVIAASISGTTGNDVIYGTSGYDDIDARQGNDKVYGRGGDDWIYGGGGSDTLYGEGGYDSMHDCLPQGRCGAYNTHLDYLLGGDGGDDLFSYSGADEIYGGYGDDYIWASQSTLDSYFYQKIHGQWGNDYIEIGFNNGGVYVYCGSGTDTVRFITSGVRSRSSVSSDCENVSG